MCNINFSSECSRAAVKKTGSWIVLFGCLLGQVGILCKVGGNITTHIIFLINVRQEKHLEFRVALAWNKFDSKGGPRSRWLLRRMWVAVGLAHSRRQQRLHNEEEKTSQGRICDLLYSRQLLEFVDLKIRVRGKDLTSKNMTCKKENWFQSPFHLPLFSGSSESVPSRSVSQSVDLNLPGRKKLSALT